tara:strand:- start:9046 stop:9246 length:201 start_codon:yes stop_codon:yes gene_type:complete
MTVTDLLRKIQSDLKEERATIAENMVLGRMQDQESYKKSVGVAEGLDRAHQIIGDMMKKLDDEEDV